ncbi:hypothetical protein [Streptomyces sp. NPDC051219]|uniref:hypothetical protein n=1 Tax=Streptomyces sp. NPDC051219 TaxID=3155283 RepID=UPI0034306208
MRASRALSVVAATCAAVALSAPVATAGNAPNGGSSGGNGGPRNVTVNLRQVHQGSTIQVSASGCDRGGLVSSNDGAFPRAELSAGSVGFATVRINDQTSPGRRTLSVRCNGDTRIANAQFTVLQGRGSQGGIGGSLGPTSTEVGVGGGLVAAATLGGGVYVMRRRRALGGRA